MDDYYRLLKYRSAQGCPHSFTSVNVQLRVILLAVITIITYCYFFAQSDSDRVFSARGRLIPETKHDYGGTPLGFVHVPRRNSSSPFLFFFFYVFLPKPS